VLIMDNASFHHTDRVKEMCLCAGVKLVFLPPYPPDLNRIEEFLSDLKRFIKKHWQEYEDNPKQDFGSGLTSSHSRTEECVLGTNTVQT
jgi:transposase